MKLPSQLVLDLAQPPALTAEDFLPAACNEEARRWVERWPDWPGFALALSGPKASGKSHLAHMFAARSGAVIIQAGDLTVAAVPDLAALIGVVIEDADRGVDETAFFHLYNLLKEERRPLLITGRHPPARWALALADLRSRLASLPVATISSPDDALLEALLVKLFADRQLRIGPDVTAYLMPRIERSFASVHALVEKIDQAALQAGRPVTVPLMRDLLG
jgi:chromosomal replication initiation ATPase DnaA